MANLVQFEMRVKGTKEACKLVLDSQQMAECFYAEEKEINGQDYIFIGGECKGSLDAYTDKRAYIDNFSIENLNDDVIKIISQMTLQSKSKLLGCEIEAFAFYDEDYCIWHGRYCKGEVLVEEAFDLSDVEEIIFDEDLYKLDCSKAFSLGSEDESIKKYDSESSQTDVEEIDLSCFEIEDGTLNKYKGAGGKVAIPSGVSSIEEYAFYGNKKLTSITIPKSVKYIGMNAFMDCANLEEVILEDPTTLIEEDAFYGCKKLRNGDFVVAGSALVEYVGKDSEVVIPEFVDVIQNCAFCNNTVVTKITLGENVRWIGALAFMGCSSLVEINIPDNAVIGDKAFSGCSSLATNNGMLIIGGTLFTYSGNDSEVEIGNDVKIIGESAFENNVIIKKVIIPETVERIGKSAFENCNELIEVTIPASVKEIPRNLFRNCQNLKTVNICEGVEKIDHGAFSECSSLESIVLPNSITKIEGDAFKGCVGKRDDKGFTVIGGVLISYDGEEKEVTIPSNVKVIGSQALYNKMIEKVVIPSNVIVICSNAFAYCGELEEAVLSEGLLEVEKNAFYGCGRLKPLELPGTVGGC